MKTVNFLTTLGLSLTTLSVVVMLGCGKYEKHPVENIDTYRDNGRKELEKGPEKQETRTETIIVEKPVEVVREQATIDENALIISPDRRLVFTEGMPATYKVGARSTIAGVKVRLNAKNLPEGAKLEKSPTEADVYLLTWTPKIYTVPANDSLKEIDVKFGIEVTETPSEKVKKALFGITREREVTLQVKRTQAVPTELAIEGLGAEVAEGTITKFQVTVKIPGIDGQAPRKPMLTVFNDLGQTAGVAYLEQDGTRHVMIDPTAREAIYVGDLKWKFSLIFDTKNISARPDLDSRGQTLSQSATSNVRFNLLVTSPFGTVTPQILKLVKIGLNRPVSAPRFDFAGLTGPALELTPGEKMKFNFIVSSADASSTVKLELPDLKTLVGAPKIACKSVINKPAKQECVLEWNVPCAATDAELKQEISMSATAVIAGRNSEPVQQVLNTVRSKKEKVGCAAPQAVRPQQVGAR
ncbi:MAG: hypothetical protein ACK5P7_11200 [Bdellovibrio sp.]